MENAKAIGNPVRRDRSTNFSDEQESERDSKKFREFLFERKPAYPDPYTTLLLLVLGISWPFGII